MKRSWSGNIFRKMVSEHEEWLRINRRKKWQFPKKSELSIWILQSPWVHGARLIASSPELNIQQLLLFQGAPEPWLPWHGQGAPPTLKSWWLGCRIPKRSPNSNRVFKLHHDFINPFSWVGWIWGQIQIRGVNPVCGASWCSQSLKSLTLSYCIHAGLRLFEDLLYTLQAWAELEILLGSSFANTSCV